MALQHEVLAPDEPTSAHQEDLDRRKWPFMVDANDVLVGNRRVDDLLLGHDPLGRADTIAQVGRAFELERLGGGFHLVAHLGQHAV